MIRKAPSLDRIRTKLKVFGCDSEFLEKFSLLGVTMPPNAQIEQALHFLDTEAETGNVAIEESAFVINRKFR